MTGRVTLLAATACCLIAGCAGSRLPPTTSFYFPPIAVMARNPGVAQAAIVNIADARSDKAIDAIYQTRVVVEVQRALVESLRASGIVASTAPTLSLSTAAPVVTISGSLKKLEWFVPNHEAMLKKAQLVSFLTGGIGGIAYAKSDTPVYGKAVLALSVTHPNGDAWFSDEYPGEAVESMDKIKADTRETKSRMVGLALNEAISAFIRDLDAKSAVGNSVGNVRSNTAASSGGATQ